MDLRRVHQLVFVCSCSRSALPGPHLWRNLGKHKERHSDEDHRSKVLPLRWFGWRQVPAVWWEIGDFKAVTLRGWQGLGAAQLGCSAPGQGWVLGRGAQCV